MGADMSTLEQTEKKAKERLEDRIDKRKYSIFISNFEYFHDQYEKLKEEFPDEYVAINEKRVVDHDKDLKALIVRLRDKWPDLGAFVIEYVSTAKVQLIL